MNCKIKWNDFSLREWLDHYGRVSHSNLLQDFGYARAMMLSRGQRARWGMIEIDGQAAGYVQITEAGLWRDIIHAVIIDRGPLWFDGFGTPDHFAAFAKALNQSFPRRWGRKRRFIPEVEDTEQTHAALTQAGFKRAARSRPYQSYVIDLRAGEEELFAAIKKSQRQTIQKAQKEGLEISWHNDNKYVPWLLARYDEDRRAKGYGGASPDFINILSGQCPVLLGRAMVDGHLVAGVLILCHGTGATYQIGWASDRGRKAGAHPALLWGAIQQLKDKEFQDLDLGGVNDDDAKALKKFKASFGGRLYSLPGIYH